MSVWERVLNMDEDEISNCILLDLDEDIYEYIHSDDVSEFISYFFALASRKIDITEKEGDKIDLFIKVFDTRLKEIIDIIGEDEDQYIDCIENADILLVERLLIFLYHEYKNISAVCKIIDHILNMENNRSDKLIKLIISMIGVDFDMNDEDIFETIISNENWIKMKEVIDNIISEEQELYLLMKRKIYLQINKKEIDTGICEYYN